MRPKSVSLFSALACLVVVPAAAHAAPFDPEAATQAYLATLKGAARAQSDAYFEGGYWLLLWGTLAAVFADFILLRTGLSARFRNWAERVTKRRFVQSMLYGVPYVIISSTILVPWTIYTGYVREKQYGLLTQGFGDWAGEQAILLVLNIIAFSLIIALVMNGIRRSPKRWWLWGTGMAALTMVFFIMIAPVFINPLFNTYTELAPGPVRDRIVGMAQSRGIPANHIYVFDQSKQHKRISANVAGIGPTIRISLNDNLLKRTTLSETAAVMGHEMGHYVLNHSLRLAIGFGLVFGFCFWIASLVVPGIVARWGAGWGIRGIDDVAAWPVYSIVITILILAMTPVKNTLIRSQESEADAFGLDVAREPDGFAQAAMQLSEYRKIEPGPVEEFLFYDHPSGRTRVRMSMEWKARHLADPRPK
ncbi:M48 family metallopeptidase [Aquisediminimonas profunda]|uniref:M48 family metallopeptidase n=1 Tax=Aquisediminimonas profunda TaxID=1550733 RepID=UPI001C63B300|nr:M48 family metallopeptidase [Aquisediminimonas profunda]